jgi:hypothetical protein
MEKRKQTGYEMFLDYILKNPEMLRLHNNDPVEALKED